MPEPTEPTACPFFIALTFDGETIEAGHDFDELLVLLKDAVDGRHGREELVIWADAETVVAVVKADGRVIRLDGEQPELVSLPHRNTLNRRRRLDRPTH